MTRARSFALVWPYVASGALGYLLGSLAVPVLAALAGSSSSTPSTRVGFVLREEPAAPKAAWAALGADLDAVRSSFASPAREVFELVMAVRGVDNGGEADLRRAEQICRALSWPRCEREALAQLKEQSRP